MGTHVARRPTIHKPDDEVGLLVRGRASSRVGRSTSPRKLNGQVYTPLRLAAEMLARVRWPAGGGVLLDPACGDGVFLEAAVRKVLDLGLPRTEAERRITEGIVGWDLDEAALAAARRRLAPLLDAAGLPGALPALHRRDALTPVAGERFACIVGNPPYLEAKRMPDALKARIRRHHPLAGQGAFDLYGAFVARALALSPGDLCFVVPNRILVAAWADGLRRALLATCELTVVDLSRQRIFDDAAVYPVVLHGRPARRPVYRTGQPPAPRPGGEAKRPAALLGARPVRLPVPVVETRLRGMMPLAPPTPAGRRLLERLLTDPALWPWGDLADVRWCVSFHRAGLRDRYVHGARPPGPHARPFLGGDRYAGNREVEPGRIAWGGRWIDYDEDRARRDGNPLPPAALFEGPKLVVCQNARRARGAVDTEGHVLKDTFLAVVPKAPGPDGGAGLLAWLCLVLHSDLFHFVYEHLFAGTRKNGGYLHFLPRYLLPFPIPPATAARRRRAAALVRAVQEAGMDAVREEAEALVAEAYGLSAAERRAVATHPHPAH